MSITPPRRNDLFGRARDVAHTYLRDHAAEASLVRDTDALLTALAIQPEPDPDPVVRSRLSMLLNDHLWQYWYYEGIPLSVRVAYWAAVETGLWRVPEKYGSRWDHFHAHMQEIKAREIALRRSETAGGWLFPGEPQALWEIARLATEIKGDFCELGSWTGRSATILCAAVQYFSPHKRVLLVDNWRWGFEGETYPFMTENRDVLIELERQLEPYAGVFLPINVEILEGLGTVKATLGESTLALLHHDAGHDYKQVYSDLEAYLPLLSEGGYLLVHDYNHPDNPGTRQAVDEIVGNEATLHRVSMFNTFGLFRRGQPSGRGDGLASLGTNRAAPINI